MSARKHPDGLHLCLGDDLLCFENDLFRRARSAARRRGATFSSEPTPLVLNYRTLPLFTLPDILEQRTIPFTDTVSPLHEVVKRRPDFTCPANVLRTSLRRNFVLHESAHVLAADVFTAVRPHASASRRAFVVDSILAEAFANAVETMAFGYARSRDHLLALSFNSYMDFDAEVTAAMRTIRRRYGPEVLLRLAFVAFACVNCGQRTLDAAVLQLAADTAFDRTPSRAVPAAPLHRGRAVLRWRQLSSPHGLAHRRPRARTDRRSPGVARGEPVQDERLPERRARRAPAGQRRRGRALPLGRARRAEGTRPRHPERDWGAG